MAPAVRAAQELQVAARELPLDSASLPCILFFAVSLPTGFDEMQLVISLAPAAGSIS